MTNQDMEDQLREAGWERVQVLMWRSPDGRLEFADPRDALKIIEFRKKEAERLEREKAERTATRLKFRRARG